MQSSSSFLGRIISPDGKAAFIANPATLYYRQNRLPFHKQSRRIIYHGHNWALSPGAQKPTVPFAGLQTGRGCWKNA